MDHSTSSSDSLDPTAVITLAQQLVREHPDARSTAAIIVTAYLETLASLLDDYGQLERS